MSSQPSTSTLNHNADNPRANLLRQVLEQGQRLRTSIVQTILSQEPMSANTLCNNYAKEAAIGPPMHAINNYIIESMNNNTDTNRAKFLAYLRGDKMSLAEEQEVLQTFRSMSNSDIYEITENAKQSNDICDCDTCKAYQNTAEINEIKCDTVKLNVIPVDLEYAVDSHKCKCDYDLESNPNLSCLKYADSLKVSVHSVALNKEGNKKLYSKANKLNITYFVEYSIPCDLLKLPVKSRTKIDTGLDSSNVVRMCSKKIINNAVYFKQISMHDVFNINDVDLCRVDLRFRICSRIPNQKGINILGFANFNMSSFRHSKALTCSQELPIFLKNNIPIVLGALRVSLQLGCGKIYFGQEFIDALNNPVEINALNETFCFEDADSDLRLELKEKPNSEKTAVELRNKTEIVDRLIKNPATFVRDKPKLLLRDTVKKQKSNRADNMKPEVKPKCLEAAKMEIKPPISARSIKSIENTVKQNKVLFGFVYIAQAQYLESISSSYLSCKPFGHEDVVVSRIIAETSNPVFNFQQRIPYVYGDALLNNFRDNCMIVEFWEQIDSNRTLIGYITISLHQFYLAFRNPDIVAYLDRNKLPVIGSDWWEPITDPDSKEIRGQAQILLALGSQIQIEALLTERGFTDHNVKLPKYEAFKSRPKTKKVTCLKTTSSKIDIGTQSEPFKTTSSNIDFGTQSDPPKMNEKSPENTNVINQDMLGQLLSQLIEQTSRNNQNNATVPAQNGNSDLYDMIPTSDKVDSACVNVQQPRLRSTSDLLDSMRTALSVPPLLLDDSYVKLDNSFSVEVVIEKALHLPTRRKCKAKKNYLRGKCGKAVDEILMPSTYVTFETMQNSQPIVTPVVLKSANPEWNWKTQVRLPASLLTNNQRRVIFKVWKKNNNACVQPNMDLDSVIGFAALDLTVLLAGLPSIQGWFHIVDFSSKCNGQIKIGITPLEPLTRFTNLPTTSCTSATCQSPPSPPNSSDITVLQPNIPEPGELLSRALKRKFTELDEITQRLRSRLSDVVGGVEEEETEVSDQSNDGFTEDFDRDINTLCIEGDYGMLDFVKEAQIVQCQQVTQSLKQLQTIEDQQKCLLIATNSSDNDSCFLMPAIDGVESSTVSVLIDSGVTVAQTTKPLLIDELNKDLAQGKQRIDSLLNRLTLMSACDTNRHVSGCSVSDPEGSSTTVATEPSLKELDLALTDGSAVTLNSDGSSNTGQITEQSRTGPEGEGSSSET